MGALLGALALGGCGARDDGASADLPSPAPAIWQVTSPEGQQAWLFGTVHSLPDGAQWHSRVVDDAFAGAGTLVVEIANLDDVSASFPVFQRLAYSPGLPPLYGRVEPGERALIEDLVERTGADPDDFAEMESWAAALVLAGGISSGDPENGVDRALIASGKPVVALEGFEQQYALFDQLPPAEQSDLLVATAREAATNDPAKALESWLTGDMAGLEELARTSLLADPELRQALLTARNQAWIDQLLPLVDQGRKPFVAVGTAHMLGDGGLPAMFAARGYRVERLQ
ncbi:TraB/GumN family protein [Alteraurantiacibacter aestuarii]